MTIPFRALMPYAHVRSVPVSIDFYSKLSIGALEHPFDAPGGKFSLSDPDGYSLTVRQP